ncbi:MAG: tetratricopeptide repeat protein [Pirellulaceae bacterium]|nr:tetratricopeptide repeat protein [Pirellulaceae bacterium]
MKSYFNRCMKLTALVLLGGLVVSMTDVALGQQRGGQNRGPRPSMGSVGGSGVGRPAASAGGMSRPNVGNLPTNRPNVNRPSMGNVNPTRPASPTMQRPQNKLPGANTNPNLGGGRPSLGGMGTPQRPNLPTTRPSLPQTNRPANPPTTRPNLPNRPGVGDLPTNRPNIGNLPGNQPNNRPNIGNLPGNTRPSLPDYSNRPNVKPPQVKPPTTRPTNKLPDVQPPTTRPGGGLERPVGRPENLDRPTTRPGGGLERPVGRPENLDRPTTRPSKPSLGGGKPEVKPAIPNRPEIGNRPRPNLPDRPTTLPGTVERPRPDRPTTRPTPGDRPVTLPGKRPIHPERPTTLPSTKPSWGNQNRPGFNNQNNIAVNRPSINNSFNNINNNITNINVNTNNWYGNRYTNRPRWDVDPGFGRPAWGLGGNYWYDRWHHNCVHHHFGWYNGCWNGYWGSSWYAPVAWFSVGWGLNSLTNSWGVQPYYNPYYAVPNVAQSVAYDYSQPIVVNNYIQPDEQGQPQEVKTTSVQQQAFETFDRGLELFKAGDYVQALPRFSSALKDLPGDAVVHEVRALAQFAVGDFQAAAAGLNSLLASAPGMDWTTLSGLYGNIDDYTAQLRKLEDFVAKNPNDASANFVLAYHYLALGAQDEAVVALQAVVANQPKDVTAKRMLEALAPSPTAEADEQLAGQRDGGGAGIGETADDLETDLVGTWRAQADDSIIELVIDENAQFRWTANVPGQPSVKLTGNVAGDADALEMITSDQGTLAGNVRSRGADSWVFKIAGSPPSDQGLVFKRAR